MRISKRQLRRIVEKSCGRGRVREMDDATPGIGTSYEDVRELAKYHALNGDKDQMLYRDNPDYKDAYDEITMKESKMRISKRQLKRIIKEEYSKLKRQGLIKEGRMKALYGDIQNEILQLGQEQGGELTVEDAVAYLSGYANDPFGDPRADYVGGMEYDEVLQIMFDMVEAGMLTGGYEDFFEVHPDYM